MQIEYNRLSRSRMKQVMGVFSSQRSLHHLGSGAFGSVYDLGGNRVLKLVDKSRMDTYIDWARFCVSHRSKHIPKIDLIASHGDKWVFVIEKLEALDGGYGVWDEADIEDLVCSVSTFVHGCDGYRECFESVGLDAALSVLPRRSALRLKSMVTEANLCLNDIGPRNLMLRKGYGKRPTIVFTDPMA